MSSTTDQLPIDPRPVGEILAGELEARGWTQADFAAVLGRPTQFVSEIITGKKEITRESAAQIGAALDQTPESWLRLQDQYLLAEQAKSVDTQQKLSDVRRRALLNAKAPIALLQKRGALKGRTLDEIEAEVLELFEIDSLDAEPAFDLAARRSNGDEAISPLQNAWVACVRREARTATPSSGFSADGLRRLGSTLPRTLTEPHHFRGLPDAFARVGVRLVYVEALPGAKIDGCAMLVDGVPVIGISGRGKRLDKVLFTLLHETAHLVLGHVNDNHYIVESTDDDPGSGAPESANEQAANEEAAGWLLPSGLPSTPTRITAPWLDQVARGLGVAPIVVVGQLQKRRLLDWRTTLARNAPTVSDVLAAW